MPVLGKQKLVRVKKHSPREARNYDQSRLYYAAIASQPLRGSEEELPLLDAYFDDLADRDQLDEAEDEDWNNVPPPEFIDTISLIWNQLYGFVKAGRLPLSAMMRSHWDGLSELQHQEMIHTITQAISPTLSTLFTRGSHIITMEELKALGGDIATTRQGCYANILELDASTGSSRFALYVGGAAATRPSNALPSKKLIAGINARVMTHTDPEKRKQYAQYRHYEYINKSGSVPNFVVLAEFEDVVEKPVVYWTEAICAILLQTYRTKAYEEARPSALPSIEACVELNQSSPLLTGGYANMAQAKELMDDEEYEKLVAGLRKGNTVQAANRETAARNNALAGGVVNMYGKTVKGKTRYQWSVLSLPKFEVPVAVAEASDLASNPEVRVSYDVAAGKHPHQSAVSAKDNEKAARLGIYMETQHPSRGRQSHWLTRRGENAPRVSNTLIDWLAGEDMRGELADDRYPLHLVKG